MKSLFLKSLSRVENIKMQSLKIKSREYTDEKLFLKSLKMKIKHIKMKSLKIKSGEYKNEKSFFEKSFKSREYKDEKSQNQESRV